MMSIEQWWPKLLASTQKWLIENNGDEVPAQVVAEITEAGGPVSSDPWWVGDEPGCYIPDEAIDWIESVANGEELETN